MIPWRPKLSLGSKGKFSIFPPPKKALNSHILPPPREAVNLARTSILAIFEMYGEMSELPGQEKRRWKIKATTGETNSAFKRGKPTYGEGGGEMGGRIGGGGGGWLYHCIRTVNLARTFILATFHAAHATSTDK